MSKLEDRLAEQLHFTGLPVPVRQLHPFWCCEHRKPEHGIRDGITRVCYECPPDGRKHKYRKTRNWAVDFAWPDCKLIVEVEGGVYTQGRHTRPSGFIKDIEKYNEITQAGWRLLRFSRREVTSGEARAQIERALKEPAT